MASAMLKSFKDQLDGMDEDTRQKSLAEARDILGLGDGDKRTPVKPRKLRVFSGAKDVPSGEVDFKGWRLHAKPIVYDTLLRDSEKKRALIDSLVGSALEIASSIKSSDTAATLLLLLDKHYGDVADGYELYSQFRTAVQESAETASEFLARLLSLATRAVEKDGMKSTDVNRQVLRQFESACADEDLLQRLNIRDKLSKEVPEEVADLLFQVRTEEARRKEKKLKLKARTARANALNAGELAASSEMEVLRKKVESLEAQVQQSRAAVAQTSSTPSGGQRQGQGGRPGGKGKFPRKAFGFCFRCGIEGHRQDACTAAPNPTLVHQRLMSSCSKSGNGKK